MRLVPSCFRGGLVVTLVLSTKLFGQTTQPAAPAAETSWPAVVTLFAQRLAGQDVAAVRGMLDAEATIRGFGSDALATPERLLASTTRARVLGVHSYAKLPMTLASDLAEDFQAAGDTVPESVRKRMIPPDGAAERSANDTAADWVVQVLQPGKNPVAVIVFWPTAERRFKEDPVAQRAVFVLVKGQAGASGAIKQIVFGDPLEAPR